MKSYHQRGLSATADYSRHNPPASAEGFRLVGNYTQPKRLYDRGAAPLEHLVYDRLLEALEDREVIYSVTQEVAPFIFHPRAEKLMREVEGWSQLSIDQSKSSIVDALQDHPQYEVTRVGPKALYKQLELEGREDLIQDNRIVPVPGKIVNTLVCGHLLTLFSESELLSCPGFVMKRYEPELDNEEAFYGLRLDLDDYLARSGFIVPVQRGGLIRALKVFKYPKDERPFILKSRGGEVSLNA